MEVNKPSLAHLADKFNTAPPPGYVSGRGRGVSGFTKPPADPPARGKPAPSSAEASGTGANDSVLGGDASDTRELDLGETERFELDEVSMDRAEAGTAIEPFNMKSERLEGHFDDDFNYVRPAQRSLRTP